MGIFVQFIRAKFFASKKSHCGKGKHALSVYNRNKSIENTKALKSIRRREFINGLSALSAGVFIHGQANAGLRPKIFSDDIRIGIVGLSVHSAAFTKLLNDPLKDATLAGCRVNLFYHPKGNPDVDFTPEQLQKFESEMVDAGAKRVGSMDELLSQVDAVMIETNDGRPHLAEVMPVFKAGKPVFIDKPVADTLSGVVEVYKNAERYKVPVFSSSALRYIDSAVTVNHDDVLGAFTYSPAPIQASHTDLFWYGIHGVELLYAVMGPGCKEVTHIHHTDKEDLVIGFWENGRVGTFRGIRDGKRDYGGTVFGRNANVILGTFGGYKPLVEQIAAFFRTRVPPVSPKETIELYTFMEAAQESRKKGGAKISLEKILSKAK